MTGLSRDRAARPAEMVLTNLMRRARQGGAAELDQLILQTYPLIRQHLWRMGVRDPDMCEECEQEVVTRMARSLHTISHPEAIVVWVANATRNQINTMHRKPEYRDRPKISIDGAESNSPWLADQRQQTDHTETGIDIDRAVASLPSDLREAMILRTTYDMTPQEIADELGISRDNVYKRLARALPLLKQQLAVQPNEPPSTSNGSTRRKASGGSRRRT